MNPIFSPIPLPSNDMFKDVMGYLDKIHERKALEKYRQQQLEQQLNEFNINKEIEKQKMAELAQYHQDKLSGNPLQRDLLKAKILAEQELASQRKRGTAGMGTGGREELFFQSLVSKDNPQLGNDPDKIYEASNAIREGRETLSDGTKLNALSPASRESLNRLTKSGSTAALVTQTVGAKGAEKELDVIEKHAMEGLKPYGDTYFDYSPQQWIDTFKTDEKSQKKLGRFIASQALQFEIAQIRNRLAMGQPGITSTQELMRMAQQTINAQYPRLSFAARMEASKEMNEALREGFRARQEIGIGASNAQPTNKKEEKEKRIKLKIVDGELVEE